MGILKNVDGKTEQQQKFKLLYEKKKGFTYMFKDALKLGQG